MKRRRLGSARPRAKGVGKRADGGPKRPEGLYFWFQLAAAVLVVVGVVVGSVVSVVRWTDSTLSDGDAHLDVVVADPLNRPAEMTPGGFLQSRATTPQVDLTVRNTGDRAVLLTGARITVEDSAWLPVCIVPGAGPVPIAGRYPLRLPFLPRPGERVVEKTLHDEVPAGGVDRMKIYFQAPRFGEDANLYALRIELSTDSGELVDGGRFVLGVPDGPYRNGEILPEDDYLLEHGDIYGSHAASVWCYRHNLSEMRRVLARPGRRSTEIEGLDRFRPAGAWAGFSSGSAARDAVPELLADRDHIYAPMVAVYAAERTGDRGLIASTRRQAASQLIQGAEQALSPIGLGPMFALVQAHAALSLTSSAAAEALIARGESGWQEVEEEQEELEMQGARG